VNTQRALLRYVKKLGNPVAQRASDGSLHLYYVTVSLGGWAGSSITTMSSTDDGASWGPARRLITSPFLNVSTLVKGTPFGYSDGSIGLPVYHEFLGKFGELLRIGKDGSVIDKQRLSSGKFSIQPVMLITSEQDALVLMRYTGSIPRRRVIAARTQDAGLHWSAPAKTPLANPDAAVAGLVLPDGRMLAVLNNLVEGRAAISIVISSDRGNTWKTLYQLEDQRGQPGDPVSYARTAAQLAKETDPAITDASAYARSAQRTKCEAEHCGFEFSYPYLIQTKNGDIHLVYTWNRSHIKHFQFTRAWLELRMEHATDAEFH
jgi:predicted neuraminidase